VGQSPPAGMCPHAVALPPQPRQGTVPGDRPDASLVDRVSHLYECEQLSTYRVAEVVGINRQRVGRILRKAGIVVKPRGAGRRRQPDARAELVGDLYVRRRLSSTEISALTGIPSRTIRDWLRAGGVPTRTRGPINREDRLAAPAEALIKLSVRGGLSAAETGLLLGVSLRVVLRTAHDLGLPVRIGGPPPRHGPAEIELVDALYADPLVRGALERHGIAAVPAGGAIWERFPARLPIDPDLITELYVNCGLGLRHIELLSGTPAETLRLVLRRQGVPLRDPGGRSPFMRRWRRSYSAGLGQPAGVLADWGNQG
jgi:hypothetical protein